jgi:hypothetical protein
MVIVTLDNLAFVHTKKRDYEKALKVRTDSVGGKKIAPLNRRLTLRCLVSLIVLQRDPSGTSRFLWRIQPRVLRNEAKGAAGV